MAVEMGVIAAVIVGGVIVLRRRLAAGALPSVAETRRRWAVELVVAGLLQLDDGQRAATRKSGGCGATLGDGEVQ
jgi:hypothetical protein